MRLGLAVWWIVALVVVVDGAVMVRPPIHRSMAPQRYISPQDIPTQSVPSIVTNENPKETSRVLRSTKDTSGLDEQKIKEELIHSEELLEKYGYLDCVPPGSEANTRLHRLLLYRRQRLNDPPGYDTLDVRLRSPDKRMQVTILHSNHKSNKDKNQTQITTQAQTQAAGDDAPGLSPKESNTTTSNDPKESEVNTPNTKQSKVTVWDPFTGYLHHLPICSQGEIEKAIKKFQKVYHVGNGGTLDSPTVGLLSSPRCGNPDSIMEEAEIQEQGAQILVPGGSRSRRRAPQDNGASRHNEGVRGIDVPEEQYILHEEDIDHIDDVPDQEMLTKLAEELRRAADARHPKSDSHLEWEPHPEEALKRRKRWLEKMSARYTSGEEDLRLAALTSHPAVANASSANHHDRDKRSSFSYTGQRFQAKLIKWRLVTAGYSSQLDIGAQRASLALAFRMWSEVIPPVFLEQSTATIVDISIGFGKRSHLGCVTEFDGLGGELGHTLRPAQDAQIHMDDDEHFTLNSDHGTNLLKVAVHEIGHVLGLGHVAQRASVMHAVYERVLPNQGFELGCHDRKRVQNLYGPCTGAFNTVFDLLRWRPDGSLTYNTFFFRGTHFWMYENRYNRTRFGDPLDIRPEWGGIPDYIDGYAHVWTHTQDIHLIFKGDQYYVYDPRKQGIAPGYPRRIAQDFHGPPTAKRPRGRTIPNKIDTVYFDKRDENLYFFKGKKVYGYDVSKGSEGCCLPGYPRRIREAFPTVSPSTHRLSRGIDAAYYSYTDQKLYFIKGLYFWEVATFHPNDKQRNNSVVGPFYVHTKWHYICDTEIEPFDPNTVS
ncbi:matrix metalloproteinase-21-like [Portunus trituberculatus]|uniref:matrix metalloproteinase-21-like n=1 Tax=Portunus trituberculatus TaxID=210409 RepID=UPI001E1CB6DF|nr:matrix metalloproteinase-21-like [Portunus trituberculatus]